MKNPFAKKQVPANSLENQMREAVNKSTREMLMKILAKAINREPTEADLHRIKASEVMGKQSESFVILDGVIIGTIAGRFTGTGMVLDFTPSAEIANQIVPKPAAPDTNHKAPRAPRG